MVIAVSAVVVVSLVFLILGLVGPMLAQLRLRTWREPTLTDDELLESRRPPISIDPARTVIIETVGDASVEVSIRGPPGYRVLFISDFVLEELEPTVTKALLAGEIARSRLYYREYQVVAATVAIALGLAALLGVIPFELGFGGLLVVSALMLAIGRWLQFRADSNAASRVGAATLADAYETIAELHDVDLSPGGWRSYLEVQPPLGDRVARLRRDG